MGAIPTPSPLKSIGENTFKALIRPVAMNSDIWTSVLLEGCDGGVDKVYFVC